MILADMQCDSAAYIEVSYIYLDNAMCRNSVKGVDVEWFSACTLPAVVEQVV